MGSEEKRRPIGWSYMHEYDLTVKQAERIGDALMPRIREAIRESIETALIEVRQDQKDLSAQIAALKTRANAWSALSGALSGLGTALTAVLMTKKS